MKILFKILLISLLLSCSKQLEKPDNKPANQFTASVILYPNDKTLYYDIFVSSDKITWVWVVRKTAAEIKSNPTFGFDVTPLVCNGITYPDMSKKLYGATREMKYGNIMMELDYNSMTIK